MPRRRKIDWPDCAEKVVHLLSVGKLHPAVLAAARDLPARQPWAVAFSGGADSLALLLVLWAMFPDRRRRFVALHFNHRLRGAMADKDENFCREIAAALKIRFRIARWTHRMSDPSEAEARVARHGFFENELRRLRTPVLWLGHQQDDVAETMLMRLARGSGSAGLAAPRPVHVISPDRIHLRPLLTLKKAEIIRVLTDLSIPWREDASNAKKRFLRNRLRQDVVPAWLGANGERDALAGAALSRELLEEDDSALEQWLTKINPLTPSGSLNLRRLRGHPRALLRRAVQRWIALNFPKKNFSRQAISALVNDVAIGRVTRHSFGSGGFAVLTKSRLGFIPARRKLSN